MIVCVHESSLIRIHRHKGKNEFYQILEGELAVKTQQLNGSISTSILSSEDNLISSMFFIMDKGTWHTMKPLTNYAIYLELTSGPFNRNETEFKSEW